MVNRNTAQHATCSLSSLYLLEWLRSTPLRNPLAHTFACTWSHFQTQTKAKPFATEVGWLCKGGGFDTAL